MVRVGLAAVRTGGHVVNKYGTKRRLSTPRVHWLAVFDALSDRLQAALHDVRGRGKLDEESISRAMREIRLALLEADVNFKAVKDFVARVRQRALGADVTKSLTPGQEVVRIVHDELTALIVSGDSKLALASRPPTVILLARRHGSRKTPPPAPPPSWRWPWARSATRLRSSAPPARARPRSNSCNGAAASSSSRSSPPPTRPRRSRPESTRRAARAAMSSSSTPRAACTSMRR